MEYADAVFLLHLRGVRVALRGKVTTYYCVVPAPTLVLHSLLFIVKYPESWVLLVDEQPQIVGDIFTTVTSGKNDTGALKVKVKEYCDRALHSLPLALLHTR